MPGDGGAAGEVPVLVVRGKLLGHVRLHNVHPLGELHLAGPEHRKDPFKFSAFLLTAKTSQVQNKESCVDEYINTGHV